MRCRRQVWQKSVGKACWWPRGTFSRCGSEVWNACVTDKCGQDLLVAEWGPSAGVGVRCGRGLPAAKREGLDTSFRDHYFLLFSLSCARVP